MSLLSIIKIKYFAGLLHNEEISSATAKSFLGYVTNSMINRQKPQITLKINEKSKEPDLKEFYE
jgi:hypothetical protein